MKTITITLTGNEDITLITEFMVLTIEHNQDTLKQENAYQDLRDEVTDVATNPEDTFNELQSKLATPFRPY